MKRRKIAKMLAMAIPLSIGCSTSRKLSRAPKDTGTIKPRRLRVGDTIGLISPGSSLSDAALEKAVTNLEGAGFKVKTGKHWKDQYGYLAGNDKSRLEDIHEMFADDHVDGIWCARGGYGCTRLLPHLDYQLIKRNPKVLIGYSDVTALLNAIYQQTGLIGFHGPVASSDFNTYCVNAWKNVLLNSKNPLPIKNAETAKIQMINTGKAQGVLVGGNLSILAAMCGTPYQVNMKDKLVFIEDVGEKPYRIDRMLTQLRQSSGLEEARGIILGTFKDCEPDDGDKSLSLEECLIDRLGGLDIPMALGYSFGHISEQFTIPIGVLATLDTRAKTFILDELSVV